MVGYHHQASSFHHHFAALVQKIFKRFHFFIYLYSQRLKHLGEIFVFPSSRRQRFKNRCEVAGALKGTLSSCPCNCSGSCPGISDFSVHPKYAVQIFNAVCVEEDRKSTRLNSSHVK